MAPRSLTTAVTLLVLLGILALGLVVGANSLFAPLPQSSPEDSCERVRVGRGERLQSREVAVNVFNAGDRSGLAGQTLEGLTARGFREGVTGNAPDSARLRRAQVWVVAGEEDAGRLVASNLGPKTPVKVRGLDLQTGGVEVMVANGFRALTDPVRSIRVRSVGDICTTPDDEVGANG